MIPYSVDKRVVSFKCTRYTSRFETKPLGYIIPISFVAGDAVGCKH